jgi:hypothetical protein
LGALGHHPVALHAPSRTEATEKTEDAIEVFQGAEAFARKAHGYVARRMVSDHGKCYRGCRFYNHERYHESPGNVTLADICYGRVQARIERRKAVRAMMHLDWLIGLKTGMHNDLLEK